MPAPPELLLFLACVALATVVQHLTAFAFGLVLLACVELLGLVPLADATNACMVLAIVNSVAFLRGDGEPLPWKPVRPIVGASVVGVVLGVAVHGWLSANAAQGLRFLLGAVVIASAANLVFTGRVQREPSRPATFAGFGLLSGVLGGLFSTSGPPIVYHLMRQPFPPRHIRRCLMLVFAINNGTRLVLVAAIGHFSAQSLLLCALALPVAFTVTRLCKAHVPELPRRPLVILTGSLLGATGVALMGFAVRGG